VEVQITVKAKDKINKLETSLVTLKEKSRNELQAKNGLKKMLAANEVKAIKPNDQRAEKLPYKWR